MEVLHLINRRFSFKLQTLSLWVKLEIKCFCQYRHCTKISFPVGEVFNQKNDYFKEKVLIARYFYTKELRNCRLYKTE